MTVDQAVRDAAQRVIDSDAAGTPTDPADLALLDAQDDETLAEVGLLF